MFVASRRLYPVVDNGDPAVLPPSTQFTTLGPEAGNLLQFSQSPPNPGSYRKFRLRCSYTDVPAGLKNPQLQLQFAASASGPLPSPGLQPSVLTLPRASTIFQTTYSSNTEWFTLGIGSVSDLTDAPLQWSAKLQACYSLQTAPLGLQATIYEIVMECWDFTSPDAPTGVSIIHQSTLLWTRPVLSHGDSIQFPVSFSGVSTSRVISHQFNLSSTTDTNRFPISASFDRVFKLRAIMATSSKDASFTVLIQDMSGGLLALFLFPGFDGDGTIHRTVMSTSIPWKPSALMALCTMTVGWNANPTATATGKVYSLALEAHDVLKPVLLHPVTESRSIKSVDRPLNVGTASLVVTAQGKDEGDSVDLGRFRELFTHGAATLDANSLRDFYVRMSWFGKGAPTGAPTGATGGRLVIRGASLTNPRNAFELDLPLPSAGGDQLGENYECFGVSQALTFRDGRALSVPNDDWTVSVALDTTTPSEIECNVTSISLEGRDRPISPTNLPDTHVYCLQSLGTRITLPASSGLDLGTNPFTISVWISSGAIWYMTNESDSTPSDRVILRHGNNYQVGITDVGSLFAIVTDASGKSIRADSGYQGLQLEDVWHNLAMVWTGSAIKLAVDGWFVGPPVTAQSPLRMEHAITEIGSSSFGGYFKAFTAWNSALTDVQLRRSGFQLSTIDANLIAHVEADTTLLITAPGAPEIVDTQLDQSAKIVMEGHGLSVATGGCACLGADSKYHLFPSAPFTLEAWVCPAYISLTDECVIVGKFDTISSGYGLKMKAGGYVVGMRGTSTVVSSAALSLGTWTHVAMTWAFIRFMTIYLNGESKAWSQIAANQTDHIDHLSTLFTVGGFCDVSGTEPKCANSFCGSVDEVCLWKVCRDQRQIRDLMYCRPAVDAPGVICNFTFESDYASYDNPLTLYGNATINHYRRSIEQTNLPKLESLTQSESMDVVTQQFSISGSEIFAKDDLDITPRDLIYIEFCVDIMAIIIDILFGVKLGEMKVIEPVLIAAWGMETFRAVVTSFVNVQVPPPEARGPLQFDPNYRPKNRILFPEEMVLVEAAVEQTSNLIMELKNSQLLIPMLESIPAIGFWAMVQFSAKLTPILGELYLFYNIATDLVDLWAAIGKLQERVKEDEDNNTVSGLYTTLGGLPANAGLIPLCVGGGEQEISVRLSPAPKKDSIVVTMGVGATDSTVLSVTPASLTFRKGDGGPKTFKVKALTKAGDFQPPCVNVSSGSTRVSGSAACRFDVREQKIVLEPALASLDPDNAEDVIKATVYMDAILDGGQELEVDFTDDTNPSDDPLPSKRLKFNPATVSLSRLDVWEHASGSATIEITLVDKDDRFEPRAPITLVDKDDGFEPQAPVTRSKKATAGSHSYGRVPADTVTVRVGILNDHYTTIVMVQAKKGDSYIIMDQTKRGSVTKKTMLIDGGYRGVWSSTLKGTLTDLGLTRLDVVNASHTDEDHLKGLIDMTADTSAPAVSKILYNDPDGHITPMATSLTEPSVILQPSQQLARLTLDDNKAKDSSGAPASEPDDFFSKTQGTQWYRDLMTKWPSCTKTAPRGAGPAKAFSNQNDVDVFPTLNCTIYGPTTENFNDFKAASAEGEENNRASTIMVLSSKDSIAAEFSALFTGDAWDRLDGGATDIRGWPKPSTKAHFTVMKVPHHGSRHSEDAAFYLAYTADVYLISTKYSSYGHPALDTMTAILKAAKKRGKGPIIITSAVLTPEMQSDLVDRISECLTKTKTKMYFFTDTTINVELHFSKGKLLDDGWKTGLTVRP